LSLPAEPKPAWAIETERAAQTEQSDADETLYLIGRPTLRQFHHFVRFEVEESFAPAM
jgi:hypothetical protein